MNGLMKRSFRFSALVAISSWLHLSLLSGPVPACPFCLAPPETWAEILSSADAVLVGQLTQLRTSEHPVRAEADFLIRSVVRSPDHRTADYVSLRFRCHAGAGNGAAAGNGGTGDGVDLSGSDETVAVARRPVQRKVFARHGLREILSAGETVTIREYVTGQPGELFLLVGRPARPLQQTDGGTWAAQSPDDSDETEVDLDRVTGASYTATAAGDRSTEVPGASVLKAALTIPELLQWDSPTPVTDDLLSYLLNAPDDAVPAALRLRYYVSFLEAAHPEIAADAWGEFARSDYADVVAVRDSFSTERLRAWIADPEMSPERLGLYGMMLGLCGTDADAEFLRQQIGQPGAGSFRFGLEGLMGGYLLLRGESALQFLEDTRLKHNPTAADEHFAVLQAIQFLSANEVHRIPPERLRTTLYMLLENSQLREIVIADLARSRDWHTTPRMVSLFAQVSAADRSAKAVVQFMQAMLKAEKDSPGAVPPEHLETARCFLDMVETEHPRLLHLTQRDFGPPQ